MPGPAFPMACVGHGVARNPWQRRRKGLDAPRGGACFRGGR